MRGFLKKLFGGGNQREIRRIQEIVEKVNVLEDDLKKLSDEGLKDQTEELKKRVKDGASPESVLPEAFGLVREASQREIKQRHFDVQIVGGVVLHEGKIAEMKTGEGKTLVATLPLFLNALGGEGAHLITVNDYLAKFQGEWMGRIYNRLGLKTGIIQNQGISFVFDRGWGTRNNEDSQEKNAASVEYENLKPSSRKEAYGADITYGTNNEFGFDYLRDNMAQDSSQLVQRELNFAIVDEVDSILIDEARTPLIISSPAEESADLYAKFALIARGLKRDEDYQVDEKARAVSITDLGVQKVESQLNVKSIYEANSIALVHHLEEALKAEALFKIDKDYVVRDGEVIIVDEFTGRLMPGRRYSEGLHQAIEAKEGVAIQRESDTLATISFQNFFRLYKKLAGMTGTAATEAEEFNKIYKLDVVEIPTNAPMIRRDLQDQIYKTAEGKYQAIVEKIKELNEKNQPVLVGTISIEKSERISKLLKRTGVKHEILNAKQHEREAKIIIQAGRVGAVTVATNMAGRGVDIILGGNPPKAADREKVLKSDGLFVLGTERHESRRIDNQLRGRSGRQGDPGVSQFFVSMEDDLMRIFGGERLKKIMERLGLPDDQPIEHSLISRSIESAQRRVEGHNFDIRKHLVDYDDVMNRQREVLYKKRRKILLLYPKSQDFLHKEIISKLAEDERKDFEERINKVPLPIVFDIERRICLSVIDQLWIEHLNTMDQLRDSIGLRGYAQVDPLIAYKEESFKLFERLVHAIDDEAISILMKVGFEETRSANLPSAPQENLEFKGADETAGSAVIEEGAGSALPVKSEEALIEQRESGVVTMVRNVGDKMNQAVRVSQGSSDTGKKVGRNDPCPCGSGKKYKKCCGR